MRASSGFCWRLCGVVAVGLVAFNALSVSAATVEFRPVSASGTPGVDWVSTGQNSITLFTDNQTVEVHMYVSGWSPDLLATYQGTLDCSTFGFSVAGALEPLNNPSVDEGNPDYLLDGFGTLPACNNVNPCPDGPGMGLPGEFACGSVIIGAGGADEAGFANGGYGATFNMQVPAGAKGTANLGVDPDPNKTLLRNNMAREIVIDALISASITVEVGACCRAAGAPLECLNNATSDECAAAGGGFFPGELCTGVDGDGDGLDDFCPLCETNADCDDGNACTMDFCDLAGGTGCQATDTTPAGQCCNPATGGLTQIDDGDQCTDDICNPNGTVSHPITDGAACDDGNGCTYNDTCNAMGACGGLDTNTAACMTIDDCPAGAQSCEAGFCVCTLETKLDLVVNPGPKPDPNCFGAGDPVIVDVVMGAGSECVTGGQFLINYDPSCLSFDSLSAGAFFPLLLFSDVDEAAGTIFGAVGVMPGSGLCTQGPEVLASLAFSKLGVCGECSLSYDSVNPQNTILSNTDGNTVPLTFNDSKAIRLAGDLTLDTPGTVVVNPDCDAPTAVVTWDDPTASDSCEGAIPFEDLICDSFHSDGVNVDHLIRNGGTFPQGLSTFECTAVNSCGNTLTRDWTVEVTDMHSLDVVVQLSPITIGDPILRCICFEFYTDCVQAPTEWCQDLLFGGPFDFIGHSTNSLKVPKGQFACLTAKDPLHTLRSVSDIDCIDNRLVAEFKGDPEFAGNWLVGGNLDCWKADGNGDTIDILDFGMFVSQYGLILDPNTPCGTEGPHSDINGDGVVDSGDFAFISQNFLDNSKNSCCEDPTASEQPVPYESVTFKQLRRLGMTELFVADLNGDQVIDATDMQLFSEGATPNRSTIKRGADAGSNGGSLGR